MLKHIKKLRTYTGFAIFVAFIQPVFASDDCAKLKLGATERDIIFCQIEGLSSMAKNDFQHAYESFDSILRVMPTNIDALTNRGWALLSLGKRETALKDFRDALAKINSSISTNSKNGRLFYQRASLFRRVKQYDLAIKDLEQAIILSPEKTTYPLDLRATKVEAKLHSGTIEFSIEELEGSSSIKVTN